LIEEQKVPPNNKTNNLAINEMANELIETRRENRKLIEEI
jgi:hypothetical protein